MASVGQKDTDAELILRHALHGAGFRYRLHDRKLPGRPNLVFPRYKSAIFVHGCYWHAHDCYRGTKPKSNKAFWAKKFKANKERDARNVEALLTRRCRVLTVWECAIKGKSARSTDVLVNQIANWLASDRKTKTIAGHDRRKTGKAD